MLTSSSGLSIAACAASTARFSPVAWPIAISAWPASAMIRRTSAKSRLMSPGIVISSEMPWMPWRSTSSAIWNDSATVVVWSQTASRRSLGITISVSTSDLSASMPRSAWSRRLAPSKANGFVTTPTVSAPTFCATCAMIGAAPVPVPPPMPAVMNTISEPLRASFSSSRDSSAASRPLSGSLPAPSPFVTASPIRIWVSASQRVSACWSVFTPTNSTPPIRASIMRSTALQPPPPMPTTLIGGSPSMSYFIMRSSLSLSAFTSVLAS